MINFDEFFDGESLKQEDLVVWMNLGMHHLPHTGDCEYLPSYLVESNILGLRNRMFIYLRSKKMY